MSPRPYCLGKRLLAVEKNRQNILAAARDLLSAKGGVLDFSMEAVARQAGVARMTVYHQFSSKTGLLESLCDTLAFHGGMHELSSVFQQPDPLAALDLFVAAFCRFWNSDRLIIRRLRALATLDPDFEKVITARDERRRHGLRNLLRCAAPPHCTEQSLAETVELLHALTSFEFFDAVAGLRHGDARVTRCLQDLARATLQRLEEKAGAAARKLAKGSPKNRRPAP